MLTPYPLEPPPPLPPLDEPWEGDDPPLRSGRRVRVESLVRFAFGPGVSFEREAGPVIDERTLVALEEPCLIRQGDAPGLVSLVGTLRVDDPALHIERAPDGRTVWITGERSRREFLFGCPGGRLEVVETDGGVRVEANGSDSVRMILVAAEDEGDRDRTLRALARKGFAGLLTQRRQHATRVDGYGTALVTPDAARNAAFAELKQELDARLEESAGGRRTLAEALGDGGALLALGLREPVRDVLRGPTLGPDLLRLFAEYARWCGDDEFLRKQWPRFEAAVRETGRSELALEFLPIAEALGDHVAVSALDGAAAGAAPSARTPLPAELGTLWGVVPDALGRSVLLRPDLPIGWREMTLERLRVGGTTLALRASRRPGAFAVQLAVTHGPAITMRLEPRLPFTPSGVLVQGEPLRGPAVTFVLDQEGEARWME